MIFIDFDDNINILVANPLKNSKSAIAPPLDDGDG